MTVTSRHVLSSFALALVVASQACATDEVEPTSFAASELGLSPGGTKLNHFYWAAYDEKPYIYKGCPDPGPEPWRETATLYARRGTAELELELGTAVPLEIRPTVVPRGVAFRPNERGLTISVGDAFVGDPFRWTMVVASGRCSYELNAQVVYER